MGAEKKREGGERGEGDNGGGELKLVRAHAPLTFMKMSSTTAVPGAAKRM